ncbi:calcineurin-like phosphoesterase family protein [Prosthecobacter fusiformis]|uniref:Calcineurin-like phosphoesterase family protein n=1 Tax=Prosthecobacter fusiformis TaxID=48464 RepID=A0A4R7RYB3_9BACT|nr:metallophosphoesterase [Prosthecobacter fusiformis]TDU70934.1 calcineurin-like phosphoesterase family protein [Prosthecobacter fusiformis]
MFPVLSSLARYLLLPVFATLMTFVPSASAADLDAAPKDSFTIAVIPDTQWYIGKGTKKTPDSTDPVVTNAVFENHVNWITANIQKQNIVFVSHVGDIVDRSNPQEWEVARRCMDRLHGVIPYSVTVGNHDMKGSGDSSLFQKYFGAERFRDFAWYGGPFEPARPTPEFSGNNANSHQLFSAGGMDFIHISLECNAPDDVLAWADALLTQYATRRAIITTHMDLGVLEHPKTEEGFVKDPKGRMNWTKNHGSRGNTAQQMWEKLYRKHANLGFIFCGDQSRCTALKLDTVGDHGNTVHAFLSDYTSSGPMRLYRFLPAEDRVQVITYDTTLHELTESTLHVKERAEHQFSAPYPMKP